MAHLKRAVAIFSEVGADDNSTPRDLEAGQEAKLKGGSAEPPP